MRKFRRDPERFRVRGVEDDADPFSKEFGRAAEIDRNVQNLPGKDPDKLPLRLLNLIVQPA